MADLDPMLAPALDFRENLGAALDSICADDCRVIITRWGVECAVVISRHDFEALEALATLTPLEIARIPAGSDESEIAKSVLIGWRKTLDDM